VTPAQLTILKHIAIEPKGPDDGVYVPTLRALLQLGLIEPCERMYFGPRKERYRLSAAGRSYLANRRPRTTSPTKETP
jgi:DNA-binding PadR family transcriptional regulator